MCVFIFDGRLIIFLIFFNRIRHSYQINYVIHQNLILNDFIGLKWSHLNCFYQSKLKYLNSNTDSFIYPSCYIKGNVVFPIYNDFHYAFWSWWKSIQFFKWGEVLFQINVLKWVVIYDFSFMINNNMQIFLDYYLLIYIFI